MSYLNVMEAAFLKAYAGDALRCEASGNTPNLLSDLERIAGILDIRNVPQEAVELTHLAVEAYGSGSPEAHETLHRILVALRNDPFKEIPIECCLH